MDWVDELCFYVSERWEREAQRVFQIQRQNSQAGRNVKTVIIDVLAVDRTPMAPRIPRMWRHSSAGQARPRMLKDRP